MFKDKKWLAKGKSPAKINGYDRRGVLATVAGGAFLAGGVAAPESAHACSDNDVGNYSDPVGYLCGGNTGSDTDYGQYADAVGQGVGGSTGYTDSDTGTYQDSVGSGGGPIYTGRNDSDSGTYADAPGYGRW